jgi:hypothetical protein
MIAAIIAILGMTVLGLPVTLAIDRRARGPLLVGAAFLYGSGITFLILLALSVAKVRWTLTGFTVIALAVFCAASILARKLPSTGKPQPATHAHVFDVVTLFALTGYALYATLAPLWEWDFWAIWGLKARVFFEASGIDWHFLGSRWNAFSHTDYPLLVPLNFDFVALINGAWSDRWLGLLCVAWGAAAVLIVRGLAARETSPFFASLLGLALASRAVSAYVGLAEGALIAFGGAGVLFVRAALRDDDDAPAWRHAALMLGFAANCKNEGLALLVAVTIAVAAVSWFRGGEISRLRRLMTATRLWPAYALAAPWLLLRFTHALPTDIAGGSAISRLMAHLPQARQILGYLVTYLREPWFWIAVLAAILIAPRAARRQERFVFLVTAIQLFFYVAAYFVTPHDLQWHVETSWARLTEQVTMPLTFVVFLMLANSLRGGQDAPHAQARSDE